MGVGQGTRPRCPAPPSGQPWPGLLPPQEPERPSGELVTRRVAHVTAAIFIPALNPSAGTWAGRGQRCQR